MNKQTTEADLPETETPAEETKTTGKATEPETTEAPTDEVETKKPTKKTKASREVILDETETAEEPDAYPQPDGTVKVILSTPLKRSDKSEITEVIILGMPLTKDMNKAGGRARILQMYDDAHMAIMPTVTQPTITPNIWNQMSGLDTNNLMKGVLHFFVSAH